MSEKTLVGTKITQFFDDHPVWYLVAALLLAYSAMENFKLASESVAKYGEIKRAAREVSEALGG